MMDRTAKTVMICPTLSVVDAAPVIREARSTAGIDLGILIASDYQPRGGVFVGNILIGAALEWGAEYLIYLNDDTCQFPQGWAARLIEALETDPTYGIAVPGCPCRTAPQNQGRPGLPAEIVELNRPSAWVVAAIRTILFRELGLLSLDLIHYADDSDFEMRMAGLGWKSVYVQDVYIHHKREKGDQDRNPWYARDRGVFKLKWGRI